MQIEGRSGIEDDVVLFKYIHRINYSVEDGAITGSPDVSTSGSAFIYPWSYKGDPGSYSYGDDDGFYSKEEGLFRYCPANWGVTTCVKENDQKTTSIMQVFPNGWKVTG